MDVIDVLNDGSDLSDDFLVAFCGSEQDAEGAKNLLTKLKESKVGLGVGTWLALSHKASIWNIVGKHGFDILKKNSVLAELLNDLKINVNVAKHVGDIVIGGTFLKNKLGEFLNVTTDGVASVDVSMMGVPYGSIDDMNKFMENAASISEGWDAIDGEAISDLFT